jgi:hypothetical protein
MLQVDYERGTKDSDVFETFDLSRETKDRLLGIAGVGTELERLHWLALDVVDVAVSKLKRFHANDQADIGAMIARGLVSHERLVERFRVEETEIELPSWI